MESITDNVSSYENVSYMYEENCGNYEKPSGIPTGGQVALVIIYSITALLAVFGNAAVIFVLACSGRTRTDLNTFLINLSVSDVTMAIFCIPFSFVQAMLGHWIFGRSLCKVVVFMQQVSVTISIYTLVAIGVDRFFAVYYPMKKRMSKHTSKLTILFIWIAALSLSVVQLFYVRVKEYTVSCTQSLLICDEWWPQKNIGIAYELFIMTITYVIPLCVLAFTYFLVARRLWGRSIPGNAHQNRDLTHSRSKRKVIKMLAIIVFLFAFCWLPLVILNVLSRFRIIENKIVVIFYFCCHWLAMANSFINPIVYGFLNDSFRTDLKRFFSNCSFGSERLQLQFTFRSSVRTTSTVTLPRSRSSSNSYTLRTMAVNSMAGRNDITMIDGNLPERANVIDLGDMQTNHVFEKPRPDVYFN